MLTKNQVLKLYEKYNVQASKRFGQNFLINESVVSAIANNESVVGKDVIEIGPGLGSLTLSLLKTVKSLTSYEIDQDMMRVLNGEINSDIFTLKDQNFLEADFDWDGKKSLVGNIPYNITSDIIFKILENIEKFSSVIIMVQKEVALRILSSINKKDYSKLTVSIQSMASVSKIIDAKNYDFFPAPKVDSMVIKLDNFSSYNKPYLDFVKKCFAFRRKTLINNLKIFMSCEQIDKLYKEMNFDKNKRPQEVSVDQYKEMYKLARDF